MENARDGARVRRAVGTLVLALALLGQAGTAGAMTAGASLDWAYGHSETRSIDRLSGTETMISTDQYTQRYGLNYSASLAPYVVFKLAYLFDTNTSVSEIEGERARSTTTMMSPATDLSLVNPWFSASAGFRRFEQRHVPGEQSPTRDTYSASFGIKERERRPSFNVLYSRALLYDDARLEQDSVSETASVSSRSIPMKNLTLNYRALLAETEDRISGFESRDLGQNARASYGNEFFDRRISLLTNYAVSVLRTSYSAGGGGGAEVTLPVAAVQGIAGSGPFGTDVFPETPQYDTVVSRPQLVDGDAAQPTDINIGYTASNTGVRNLGLVFAAPSTLNVLSVTVNQDVTAIAGSFVWDVYTSADLAPIDTGPKRWTLLQPAATATFVAAEKRFEIRFPNTRTQFIKLVVRPLLSPAPVPGIDVLNVTVTELGASYRATVGDLQGTTTRSWSQTYDLSLRTKLLSTPLLHHEFYYWHTRTTPDGISRYLVSNGLTASRRFGRVFSATLRGGRTDSDEQEGHRTSYTGGASLAATPLPSLSHSLVLSRGRDRIGDAASSSWSAYLNNYAEPYSGINISAGAGTSESTSSAGAVSRNRSLNAGATVVPHRALSINLSHANTTAEQHGGGSQGSFQRTTSNSAGVSYTPVPALYLYAARGITTTSDAERTRTESYSVSWSPFAGGALQLNTAYSQDVSYPADQRTTQLVESMSWRVNPRMHVSGSAVQSKTESPLALSRTRGYNASFRWLF